MKNTTSTIKDNVDDIIDTVKLLVPKLRDAVSKGNENNEETDEESPIDVESIKN